MVKPAHALYEGIEFSTAEIAQRQAIISQNTQDYLQRWEGGLVDPGLFPYQEPAFQALLKFTHETGQAKALGPDELVIPSGYMDEPTSFGKTALIARYMEAMGIGTLPTPDSPMPLRAVVSTLSQFAVKQTASLRDLSRGLKKFLPGIDITACFADHIDLSGQSVVSTQRMLLLLTQSGALRKHHFDVVLDDEAHGLLGRETSKAWRIYAAGKRAIGLTASPEYGPHKNLDNLYDHLVHRSDLRELVVAGALSGVQVFGFGTGEEVTSRTGPDDFSENDLAPLIHNQRRNQAICDITAQMVAENRRGIINALPGESLYHPQLLAGALNGRKIIDEQGNERAIRAASVGTHLPQRENDKIMDDFRAGVYDVVVQVDKLNQSFDYAAVSFIVNAAPTLSNVRAIQRLGRLMRVSEEWPLKTVIEFIDTVVGPRTQVTAWHVLKEEDMRQGAIVASPDLLDNLEDGMQGGLDSNDPRSKKEESKKPGYKGSRSIPVPDPRDFNELLSGMYEDYSARLLGHFILSAKKNYGPPRSGWKELWRVVEEKYSDKNLGPSGIRGLLERQGEGFCEIARGPSGPTYFVTIKGQEFLGGYDFPEYPPTEDWKTERELADLLNTTRELIKRCSQDLTPTDFLSRNIHRVHGHFGPTQCKTIKGRVEQLKKQETAAKTLIFSRDLASEPGVDWNRTSIHYFLATHHGIEGQLLKSGSGPDGRYYTQEEADIVRRHRRHSLQVPLKDLKKRTVIDLEAESGASREEILITAEELGLTDQVKDGRYKDLEGAFHYTEFATPAIADRIIDRLRNPPAQPNTGLSESAAISHVPKGVQDEFDDDPERYIRRQLVAASRGPRQPKQPPAQRTQPARPQPSSKANQPKATREAPKNYVDILAYLHEQGLDCPPALILRLTRQEKLPVPIQREDKSLWGPEETALGMERIITSRFPVADKGMMTPAQIVARFPDIPPLHEGHIAHVATQVVSSFEGQTFIRLTAGDSTIKRLDRHYGKILSERIINAIERAKKTGNVRAILRFGRL